jgi:hypothetical protein
VVPEDGPDPPGGQGVEVDLHDLPGGVTSHHDMVRGRLKSGRVVEERDIDPPGVGGVTVHDLVGPAVEPRGELGDQQVLDDCLHGWASRVVALYNHPVSAQRRDEPKRSRATSDEHYVLDLCDTILGERGERNYRKFDWLRGDAGTRLPVDSYWSGHGLVVEYNERQHYEPVAIFDKPNVITVSGVHRGEQRRLYDLRRQELVPAHGLRLVVIRSTDLAGTGRRLRRDVDHDAPIISKMLGAG